MNQRRSDVKYLPLTLCIALWLLRIVIWSTPNNVLHEYGYSLAVAQDFILNLIIGLFFTILLYKKRNIFQPKLLYFSSLFVVSTLAFTPVVFLLLVFSGVLFFGVTV